MLVVQLYLTPCNPMDCSLLGSSTHEILSRGSSQSRDWAWVSCTAGRFFTVWASVPEIVPCQLFSVQWNVLVWFVNLGWGGKSGPLGSKRWRLVFSNFPLFEAVHLPSGVWEREPISVQSILLSVRHAVPTPSFPSPWFLKVTHTFFLDKYRFLYFFFSSWALWWLKPFDFPFLKQSSVF